jgi:hypothetical protein
VRGELDRLARRLRPAVDREREPVRPRTEEQLGRALALRGRQQDSLTRRSEREQAVQTPALEEGNQRIERVLVEDVAAPSERRGGGRECPFQHRPNLRYGAFPRAWHEGTPKRGDKRPRWTTAGWHGNWPTVRLGPVPAPGTRTRPLGRAAAPHAGVPVPGTAHAVSSGA